MALERRFFVKLPTGEKPSGRIALSSTDSHHLAQVLRAQIGDELTLIDRSSGTRFLAKVSTLAEIVEVEIGESLAQLKAGSAAHTIFFALSKGDTLDLVVQKCTELGVQDIRLWQASRSVARFDGKDLAKKLERYQKIAEAAAKQSNRSDIPRVSIGLNLESALENLTTESLSLICSLHPEAALLRTFEPHTPVNFAIGPEGGLTDDEEQLLMRRGFQRASLGPTVLRCETAAIAAIAMANALWGGTE